MLESLSKLFTESITLSADVWLIIMLIVIVAAFAVSLVMGLLTGKLKTVKGAMKMAIANPNAAVGAMKKMPADIKGLYRTARMSNIKPSVLITEQVCVGEPYKRSLISKVWLLTLVATLICSAIAFLIIPVATMVDAVKAAEEALETLEEAGEESLFDLAAIGTYVGPMILLVLGGILTLVGGIVGRVVCSGSAKTYAKFVPAMDGEAVGGANMQMQAQQTVQYGEEPVQAYTAEDTPVYAAEPTAPVYAAEPQQPVYEQAAPIVNEPQESDEDIRRRAREEALAQARAQQAAQQQQAAQAQAQARAQQQTAAAQPQTAQAQAAPAGASSVDDVIERINNIEQNGASREVMREVATQLQKERAKPENKTPETQKRLNEALSKLLKAMSAATKK